MNQTYNVFIDNGIFVTAHLLKKDVTQLSDFDLKSNITFLSEVLYKKLQNEDYRKLCEKVYTHNSCLTKNLKDPSLRLDAIKEKLNLWINYEDKQIKDEMDTCIICGEKKVVRSIQATRADVPGITSGTFMNYSNNLQLVNICPICMFYSLIASFNFIKYKYILAVHSPDCNVMSKWTEHCLNTLYINTDKDTPAEKEEKKEKVGFYDHIKNILSWLVNSGINTKEYITITMFDNMGQSEYMSEYFIDNKKITFLKKLNSLGLFDEFFDLKIINILFKNDSEDEYLKSLIKWDSKGKKYELICSQEILMLLDKEVSTLEESTSELIKSVSEKVFSLPGDKEIDTLKKIQNISDFESTLVKWQETYKKQKNEDLFLNAKDFETLVNPRIWKSIRRRIIFQFILMSNYE